MPDATPTEVQRREDAAVLGVLAASYPALLSADEVAREVGDQLAVPDALARLRGAGLVRVVAPWTRIPLRRSFGDAWWPFFRASSSLCWWGR
jgi:hypothetical protein